MWSPAWERYIPRGPMVGGEDALLIYRNALKKQALGAPRDSPALPLIHNVGKQIPAANEGLK